MISMYKIFRFFLNPNGKSVANIRFLNFFIDRFINSRIQKVQTVKHLNTSFSAKFAIPSPVLRYRADTFSTKEPETLKWIDAMQSDPVLWDIGANVGVYSIYAAMRANARVIAFEPSVFNLEWLARNIYLNKVQDRVAIVPVALTDRSGFNLFKMSSIIWGGALSTFGENFDQNGKKPKNIFEYQTAGLTLADAYKYFSLPRPTHIKIDVDGLEHFILRGGGCVLEYPKQILVEVNDAFAEQARETTTILTEAGFNLKEKFNLGVPNHFNQLWCR